MYTYVPPPVVFAWMGAASSGRTDFSRNLDGGSSDKRERHTVKLI